MLLQSPPSTEKRPLFQRAKAQEFNHTGTGYVTANLVGIASKKQIIYSTMTP